MYTPSAGDIAIGNVTLTLTTDDPTGPCSFNSDDVLYSFVLVPTADAGVDQDICSDLTVSVTGVIGGSATSLTWSSSGTGTFDDATSASAVYTPSVADLSSGSVTISLATDDPSGVCGITTDDMVVTFFPFATANAGVDQSICSDSDAILGGTIGGSATSVTWTSTGTGIFTPDVNTLNATYITSLADQASGFIVLTMTTNDPVGPCPSVSDDLELSISPVPLVSAGADLVVCAGLDAPLNGTISGAVITGAWTGGAGTFSPSASDLNATYTPTAAELSAGSVILTLVSDDPIGPCLPVSDDVLVSFSSPAIVSAGSDEVICEGEDVVLNGSVGGSAVSANWSGSTGVFTPGSAALNATFTPSAIDITNGFVVLTITSNDPAGPCEAVTDDVLITINPTPILSSNSTFDACSGAAVDYDITSAVSSNFSWVAESNHPSLSGESLTLQNSTNIDDVLVNSSGVSQTINYLVTATALGSGCINADQVVAVTVNLISSMNTPADQTVCYDENTADIIFTASDPTLTYSWTHGNPNIGLALSGTGDILSFTALNTTGIVQVATITVTPSLNGCPGSPETFTITVNPNSTVNVPPDLIACDGQLTTDVIFTGSDPAITYSWTNTNGTIGLGLNGTGDILAFTAQNVTNVPVVATITVTPTLNACAGSPESFDIIANPSPEMNVPADQTTCVTNNTADIIFSSNVTGAIYSWVNDNTGIGLAASGTGDIPSFTTTTSGSSIDTATITVTPSFNGCDGPSVSFQIIITPILEVDPIPSNVYCAGDDFPGVSFTGNVLTTVYQWSNDNTLIGLPISGTGDISGFTLIGSTTVEVATIIVTPELSGCTAIADTFTITVKPLPTVSVVPIIQTLCHNEPTLPIDFSGNIVNADYDWDHNNVSIGIGTPGFGDIPSFTATNTTLIDQTANFTVIPSYNGCIGESETFTITVKPKPTVFANNPDQVLCAGDVTSSIGFDGNFGPVATYNWTNDNVDIGLSQTGSGDIPSFTVTNVTADIQIALIVITPTYNGCDGIPDSITITVHPTPTVDGPIPDQSLCVNAPTDTVFFTGNLPLTTNYNWTNDNTAIGLAGSGTGDIASFNAQGNPSNVTIATIMVTPELNGCVGITDTFTITTVDPIPIVVDPADQVVCEGDLTADVIFTGPNPITSFIWSNNNFTIGLATSGTGDILSFTADNTFLVDQTATITVIPEYNGCLGTSQEFTITVKPAPEAFVDPAIQELCSGEVTNEIFFTSDLSGAQMDWTNDNASIGLTGPGIGDIPPFTVSNTSSSVQTATVSVVPSFNGCAGDTATATIIVNPISTVVVSSGIDEYCHNDPTLDYIFSGSSGSSTYNWINSNISIGLPASGSGDILSFTATNTDLVNQLAIITVEPILNGCVGVQQIFQILVKPIPTVDAVPNQNLCANDNTDAIVFDGTMSDSTLFIWTNDNTSIGLTALDTGDISSFLATNTSQNIQVGNITVTPHLNSCIGTSEMISITVNPISTVNAIGDTVCAGDNVPQIDFIGNNASSVYTWVNDNVSIGLAQTGLDSIASFTALNAGTTIQIATIIITPTVNGCPGINDTIQIQVNPTPILYPISDIEYCAEENTAAITFGGNMASNQYDWINDLSAIGLSGAGVGDVPSFYTLNSGNTDLIANIDVTPSANGCVGTTESFTITVHPLPVVDAGLDTTLCFGQHVTLTATGAISYQWDNAVINGVLFYPNSTIMYHVIGTDANLCQNEDSVLVTYLLDIPPVVDAGPDQVICFSDSVTLTASGDAVLYQWNNGVLDGVPFSPAATNTYVVIGTALNGCLEADTVEVVVNPLPTVTANASDDFLCDGESTILWGEGANLYIWDQGVLDSVSFVPPATSTYTVIGYDLNGCTDTTDIEVIVNPLPDVLFSTDMTYGGCIPFSPTFTDLTVSPPSNSVMWYFGNGASSTQTGSVINTYDSYGCYDVTLVSTTAEGCTDSLTQNDFVCVYEVIASFYPDVYEQSVVNPIFEFTNESVNAATFEWFFGDGTESNFVNVTHFYNSYGIYNVTLVAMAEDGCTDTAYVAVTVNDEILFYVPNSFTPNEDGKNEMFIPVLTAGYDRDQGYVFSIYNRWGEEVFNTDVPGEGWDGTFNNAGVQNGTYIWYLKFKDSMNNQIHYRSGHVNVIK
jgi:gliding motility-associated-like protein